MGKLCILAATDTHAQSRPAVRASRSASRSAFFLSMYVFTTVTITPVLRVSGLRTLRPRLLRRERHRRDSTGGEGQRCGAGRLTR